jgi:hypothetical protein
LHRSNNPNISSSTPIEKIPETLTSSPIIFTKMGGSKGSQVTNHIQNEGERCRKRTTGVFTENTHECGISS